MIATCLLILLAGAVIVALTVTGLVPARPQILLPSLLLALSAAASFSSFLTRKKRIEARQTYFYLVVLTCLVLGGGWLMSALIK